MLGLRRGVRIAAGMLGERNLVRKEYSKRSDTIAVFHKHLTMLHTENLCCESMSHIIEPGMAKFEPFAPAELYFRFYRLGQFYD